MAHTTRGTTRRNEFVEDTEATIAKGIQGVGTAAKRLATDSIDSLRGTANEFVDQGRTKAHEVSETVQERVREEPVKSLLLAAAAGFLIGVFWMRR